MPPWTVSPQTVSHHAAMDRITLNCESKQMFLPLAHFTTFILPPHGSPALPDMGGTLSTFVKGVTDH